MNQHDHYRFMELAIEEAEKSRLNQSEVNPLVGAVVVSKGGKLLASSYRGQNKPGEHAEYTALEGLLPKEDLVKATVYTTLEPCTSRNSPKVSCAERLIGRRVGKVVIGMLDPNQSICGRGVRMLRDADIAVELFSSELMAKVEAQNHKFIREQLRREVSLIPCGLGQADSPYDFSTLADNETKELVIVAQNMRTLSRRTAGLLLDAQL